MTVNARSNCPRMWAIARTAFQRGRCKRPRLLWGRSPLASRCGQ